MNIHTKRRQRRRAKAKLACKQAVRRHTRRGGRTGGIRKPPAKRFAHRAWRPNPPGPTTTLGLPCS